MSAAPKVWRPSSYGAGPRHWYVTRGRIGHTEVAEGERGRYRRFGSFESAKRAADALNRAESVR